MTMNEIVKLVRQPDWLLGREIEVPEIGIGDIVAVDPEKNEVTVARCRHKRVKVTIDFVEDFFLREIVTDYYVPTRTH